MWTNLWIVSVLVVLKNPGCSGYSRGAPPSACVSLTPKHRNHRPQTSPPLHKVEVFQQDGKVNVLIPNSPEFQGFVLQARSNNDRDKIVQGTFKDEQDVSKTVDCSGGSKNTLTHMNPKAKQSIATVWTPAPGTDEEVIFRATVAETYDRFWTEIDSAPVRVRREDSSGGEDGSKSESMDYSQCGISKGCFGFPLDCVEREDCEVLVSYTYSQEGVSFTMEGSLSNPRSYIATGISEDNEMGDDSVMECFIEENGVSAQESWNTGKTNRPIRKLRNEEYSRKYQNGIATCSWTRPYDTRVNNNIFNLLDSTYHILIAKGDMNDKGGVGYHTGGRLASAAKVNFTAFESIGGAGVDPAIKIHGETSTSGQPSSSNANPPLDVSTQPTDANTPSDTSTQQPVSDKNSPGVCSRTTTNILLLLFSLILLRL